MKFSATPSSTFSRYRKQPLLLMCSWLSISAVSLLMCCRRASSWSSLARMYCCTSRTTCDFRRSSRDTRRKPVKRRATARLCLRNKPNQATSREKILLLSAHCLVSSVYRIITFNILRELKSISSEFLSVTPTLNASQKLYIVAIQISEKTLNTTIGHFETKRLPFTLNKLFSVESSILCFTCLSILSLL